MKAATRADECLRVPLGLLLIAAVGCHKCIDHPDTAAAAPVVRLPRDTANVLIAGLPLGVVDSDALSKIVPEAASSHVQLWIEFEYGPRLTMVHASSSLTTNLDDFIGKLSKDSLAPLEVDTVSCETAPDGTPMRPGPDGRYAMPEFRIESPGAALPPYGGGLPPPRWDGGMGSSCGQPSNCIA